MNGFIRRFPRFLSQRRFGVVFLGFGAVAWFAAGALLPFEPAFARGQTEAPAATSKYQRIVSMVPSITETLFALGVGEHVVGVSQYCDFPPRAAELPRVGSFVTPLAEAIVTLQPDLVLTSPSPGNQGAVKALERAGLEIGLVFGDRSVREIRAAIETVAVKVGVPERGKRLVAAMDAEIEGVRASVADRPKTSVVVVVGHDPLVLAGTDSYLGELVRNAGGRNVADGVGGRWPRVGWEFVVSAAPDVVIDVSMGVNAPTDPALLLERWRPYGGIPAVENRRVHGHHGFLLLRPGPRLGEAARLVASLLHPEAFLEPGANAGTAQLPTDVPSAAQGSIPSSTRDTLRGHGG